MLRAVTAGGIPADTIRDAVQAIARGRDFHRSLTSSILDRLLRWLGDMLDRLFTALGDVPNARSIGIAIIVVAVVLVIARIAYSTRLGVDQLDVARARRGHPRTNPLTDAEQFAAQGAWLDAAHALYRASLEAIARHHGVRLHPSRTSGDYVRDLRRLGSPAALSFRHFARRYDRIVFGHTPLDARVWAELRADFDQLVRQERAA